jgi:hypothetical protein
MLPAMRTIFRAGPLSRGYLPSHAALFTTIVGCAHAAEPKAPTAAPPSTGASEPVQGSSAPSATRDFPRDADFRELVLALDDEKALGPAEASCLLARTDRSFRFRGPSGVALHPLPPNADDLDDAMREAPALRVLTRHGSFGAANATLGFVALTQAQPMRNAAVLVVTDRGYYLRTLTDAQAVYSEQAAQVLEQARSKAAGSTLYVSAEGRVALTTVYDLLEALVGFPAPVVLAAALPSDVVLPAPAKGVSEVARCPDGLPETDAMSGDLPVADLQQGMTASGDRLTLAMRVDANGRVSDACIVASEANDPALSACVLVRAHGLTFPKPSPSGVVDVELPLTIRPEAVVTPAPVCP